MRTAPARGRAAGSSGSRGPDRRAPRAVPLLALALLLCCPPAGPAGARYPVVDPRRGVTTMAPLLERATPAVVNISVESRGAATAENPLMRDPFFRRFFNMPEDAPRAERDTLAAGSGVIVDARQGLVVTNHHVVDRARRIAVTLKDGRELEARLVGSDPATEIALLRIPAEGLSELPYGDSGELLVGDIVLAIGNPFGLGQTVTSGIVSALGRGGIASDRYEDFIQTDAPINPGNSGGALVDTKGELVGINTAIIAPGGGNVGIGFAVPSNMVRAVVDQLLRHGEVRRGRIGVAISDVSPQAATAARLRDRQGAVITRVEAGSTADRAGLRSGDIVVSVDGSPVRNSGELRNRVGLVEVDRTLELVYVRDGERRTAQVRIGAAPTAGGTRN